MRAIRNSSGCRCSPGASKVRAVPIVVAILALAAFAEARTPAPAKKRSPRDETRFRASVAVQKTVNRYFLTAVLPKLKNCWKGVKGKGSIEINSIFGDDRQGGWAFQKIQGSLTHLPKDQAAAAVSCMESAATGTSFPRDQDEKAVSYLVSWTWPVPLPADVERRIERALASGGGQGAGCDGRGSPPRCVACTGSPLMCAYVCVGGTRCEVQAIRPDNLNSSCTQFGKCASGGLLGVVGDVIY